MQGYPVMDIQRHVDELKSRGKPSRCAHCGAGTEGEYCPDCLPFYQEDKAPSLWRQMKLFQREWSTKFWAAMDKRYILAFVEINCPELWVIAKEGFQLVARFGYPPALDEIVAAALGDCTCGFPDLSCPTCVALARMTADDELPF